MEIMPAVLLLILASATAVLVSVLAFLYPSPGARPKPASDAVGRKLGEEAARHPWIRRLLRSRLDPETATGLALTAALAVIVLGGLLVGVLAYLVRSNARLVHVDASVGQWGADHAAPWSTQILQFVTDLASTPAIIIVAVVVAVAEALRAPNRWVPVFLATVIVGEVVLVNSIKQILDRVRPTFNPIAETLGPSFPSGHSASAAALYAAVGLVLARRRSPRTRALLAGLAAGIAVGVACSRVMLGVHWLSDVIAGLAFGWAWFSVCAVAFGGRFLRFAAPVQKATRVADQLTEPSP